MKPREESKQILQKDTAKHENKNSSDECDPALHKTEDSLFQEILEGLSECSCSGCFIFKVLFAVTSLYWYVVYPNGEDAVSYKNLSLVGVNPGACFISTCFHYHEIKGALLV